MLPNTRSSFSSSSAAVVVVDSVASDILALFLHHPVVPAVILHQSTFQRGPMYSSMRESRQNSTRSSSNERILQRLSALREQLNAKQRQVSGVAL